MLSLLKKDLHKLANPEKAKLLQRFFKTGRGEYGEGDVFLGIIVPDQRKIAGKYKFLNLKDIQYLLNSKFHEERMVALFILVEQYKKGDELLRKKIFDFYLNNTKKINNWDLVDLSAVKIIGHYLYGKDKSVIYKFIKSKNIWERRIAVMATLYFINQKQYKDALQVCENLLHDNHDLIHKATGWMLREIGKRNMDVEEEFLKKYYKIMPRMMLRYAIEKFDIKKRQFYLLS